MPSTTPPPSSSNLLMHSLNSVKLPSNNLYGGFSFNPSASSLHGGDDYGMDYGSPASPKPRQFANGAGMGHGGSSSNKLGTPGSSDAPPTGTLFEMAGLSGNAGTLVGGPWSPNVSKSSSMATTPVLKQRPLASPIVETSSILPQKNLSVGLGSRQTIAQQNRMASNSFDSFTVRVLGFPPHEAENLQRRFRSFSSSSDSVTIDYVPGNNHMTINYPDTAGFDRAMEEDMREVGDGVLIAVKAAPVSSAPKHHKTQQSFIFEDAAPRVQQQQHQQHDSSIHGFHPYSRMGPISNTPQRVSGKGHIRGPSSPGSGAADSGSSPRRLGNGGYRGINGTGSFSPERTMDGLAMRRVHANHSSGSVFANGNGSIGNANGSGSLIGGNGAISAGGDGVGGVRAASMWSQVINTVFGW
ncbi:hypothetical protein HDU83_005075 [Entophlyctis luteolus]|nr:hypothetical protein HDU83_005075 [Entophlyctis luteolus]